MTRLIMSGVLVATAALAFLAGMYTKSALGTGRPKEEPGKERPAEIPPTPKEDPKQEPKGLRPLQVYNLDLYMTAFGEEEYSPCYLDEDRSILYRWEGIIFSREQLPPQYKQRLSRPRVLVAKDFSSVNVIEPIVRYREAEGRYRPGFLFHDTFYEWKGITLDRDEIHARDVRVGTKVVAFDLVRGIIEMEIPARMKEFPQIWKSL